MTRKYPSHTAGENAAGGSQPPLSMEELIRRSELWQKGIDPASVPAPAPQPHSPVAASNPDMSADSLNAAALRSETTRAVAPQNIPAPHGYNPASASGTLPRTAEVKWLEYQQKHHGERVNLDCPVEGECIVTSPYGLRPNPFSKRRELESHPGIDIAMTHGAPPPQILAAAGGVVLVSGHYENGYGPTVIIGHADGTATMYAHLNGRDLPQVGDVVEKGERIGIMGGAVQHGHKHTHQYERTTGTHLLFCVQPDPLGAPREFAQPMINGDIPYKNARLMGQENTNTMLASRDRPVEVASLPDEPAHGRLHYQETTHVAQAPHTPTAKSTNGHRII